MSDGTDTAIGIVSITVSEPSSDIAIYVFDIDFVPHPTKTDWWAATFEIRADADRDGVDADDANTPAAGVAITVTFAGKTFSGTTDSNGVFTTGWIRNLSGYHGAQVTDLALTGYLWDMGLGEDDSDGDADFFPDEYWTF